MLGSTRFSYSVVQALLTTVPIETPDAFGWTPFHHAVVVSKDLFEAFMNAKADKNKATLMGATIEDLEKFTGKKWVDHSKKCVTLDIPGASSCTLDKLSDEDLKKWTGLSLYSDTVIYPPEQYMPLWQQVPQNIPERILTKRFIRKGFQEWLKNPPRLVLGVANELKITQSLILELRVDEDMAAGTVVGEYAGLYNPSKNFSSLDLVIEHNNDDFQGVNVTAEEIGNATRWSNHGFPNAALIELPTDFGTPRHLLILLFPAKKGTRVLWDYGLGTSLTWGKQHLFNREEMRQYYQKGLKVIAKECDNFCGELKVIATKNFLSTSDNLFIKHNLLRGRLFYPFNNPAVLLDLHCSGASKAQEALEILENPPPFLADYIHHKSLSFTWIKLFLKKFIAYDTKLPATLKPSIYQWILSSIGPLSCLQILKGLQRITNEGAAFSQEALSTLSKELATYEWKNDPDAPLSFKNAELSK